VEITALMTRSSEARKLEALVRHALLDTGSVVLAVSGGLDSMVLLDLAARLHRRLGSAPLTVATFDHASGPHSQRAASFVARRAVEYGLPVVVGRDLPGGKTEAAWRAARRRFLISVAQSTAAVVFTAHTRDDHIETVLMRALRGAGARGLAGLKAASDVRRPFLCASRSELSAYAMTHGVEWIEDPTNRSSRYLRNRIRRDVLPALRRVQPAIDDDLLDVARRAATWRRELAALVDRYIRCSIGHGERGTLRLDVAADDLASYSRPMLDIVWPELASRIGVTLDARGTRRAAEFTISSRTGGRIQLSGGWELSRSRTHFELRLAEPTAFCARTLEAPMVWDRWSFRKGRGDAKIDAWSATFADGPALMIRAWRPGDRLTISHNGRLIARKVKYFLSDAGISGHIRSRWPVVIAGDEVVWIPGVRRSDAATARSGGPVVTYVCDYLDRRS
jgi:tRNA(Ile)-lysidine synthase